MPKLRNGNKGGFEPGLFRLSYSFCRGESQLFEGQERYAFLQQNAGNYTLTHSLALWSEGKRTGGKRTGGKRTGGKRTGGKRTGGKRTGGKRTGGKRTGGKRTGGKQDWLTYQRHLCQRITTKSSESEVHKTLKEQQRIHTIILLSIATTSIHVTVDRNV